MRYVPFWYFGGLRRLRRSVSFDDEDFAAAVALGLLPFLVWRPFEQLLALGTSKRKRL